MNEATYQKWATWVESGRKPPRPTGLPTRIPQSWWTRYHEEHPPKPKPPKSMFSGPGLFTDSQASEERATTFAQLLGEGRWVAQQAQNGSTLSKPVDLPAWVNAGFIEGVWGVTYAPGDFVRDGAALAQRAIETGSKFLIIDAEECLKNIDPTPLIKALSVFTGPKALSTYGAASGLNIFPINYKAFIDAGYDILPQAYKQITPEYAPLRCIEHMKQVADRDGLNESLVLSRTHLTIYTTNTASDVKTTVTAKENVALLNEAGVGRDVSLFMPEYDGYGYDDLRSVFV